MNTLVPYVFEPITDFFGYLVQDETQIKLNQFKTGNSAGFDWCEKQLWRQKQQFTVQLQQLTKRFNEPSEIKDVLSDNYLRLTLFAGLERFFAIRQGYDILKTRFTFANTNQAGIQHACSSGIFRGYFKGSGLNLLHFISTQYHALIYQTGFTNHLMISTLLEAIFFPLDTLKTRYYCDLQNNFTNYRDLINKTNVSHLFRGIQFKLAYNAVFLVHLRNVYNEDYLNQMITLPLWAASYALLTLKTRAQISDTHLTFNKGDVSFAQIMDQIKKNGGYRQLFTGVVPFIVLNQFVCYQFFALYSKSAQNREIQKVNHLYEEKLVLELSKQYDF